MTDNSDMEEWRAEAMRLHDVAASAWLHRACATTVGELRERSYGYDEARAALESHLAKVPESSELAASRQPAADIEQMLRECVPGGDSCDPQAVCDAIRDWVARQPAGREPT